MSQFVTLSRNDKNFRSFLTGQFSKDQFAQPVRNLSVNTSDEKVTFKLIDKKALSLLGALGQWYSLPRNIYLVFPLVGGISYLVATAGWPDWGLFVSSTLCLQLFMLGLTLYNDYSDYVNGIDRINEYSSQKPLVLGTVRPYQAKQLAQIFLSLSVLCASYCFYHLPSTLFLGFFAFVLGLSLSSTFVSRQYKGVSLVATFLMGGPLLVLGFEYLFYQQMTLAPGLLGAVFGYHALKYDFTKQVREIFYSSKANVTTLSTFFGFERSKVLYSLMSLLHLTVLGLFAWYSQWSGVSMIVVVSLCFEFYINAQFYKASSFLSSSLSHCLSLQKLHYSIESLLFVFLFLSPLWLSLY